VLQCLLDSQPLLVVGADGVGAASEADDHEATPLHVCLSSSSSSDSIER
jgi:hypothetical protein